MTFFNLYITFFNLYITFFTHSSLYSNHSSLYSIYPIGKEIKTTEKTAFQISIETENFEFINLLLENENLDVNYPYKITKNEFDERFVEKDFYSDSQAKSSTIEEISLLEMVIENQNIEMVQFLLSISNLDVNITNKYIKRKPIFQEFIPVTIDTKSEIEFAYNEIISVFEKKIEKSSLYIAVENENLEIIQLLLNNQTIDVNLPYKSVEHYSNKTSHEEEEEEEEEEEWLDDEIEIINENSNENELNEIKNEEEDDYIEEEEDKTDVSNDYDDEKYFQPFLSSEEQDLFEKMEENIEKDQKEWNEDIQYDDDIIETENEGEDENDRKIKYTDKEEEELMQKDQSDNESIEEEIIDENYRKLPDEEEKTETNTPLHIAVKKANIKIIEILLSHSNIDIEAQDEKGNKPIQLTNDDNIKKLFGQNDFE